jgi:hypothetical protein
MNKLTMESEFLSMPAKRAKMHVDFAKCIFCQTGSVTDLQNLTMKGFATVQYAVLNRNDTTSIRLKEFVLNVEEFMQNLPKFHQACRKEYTNRKLFHQKKEQKKRVETSVEISETVQKLPRKVIDYKVVCFICERVRDRKGVFNLILIETKNREQKLHQHAKYLGDDAMLTKIEGYGETCRPYCI